jgi:hypothetical protein
MNQNLRFSFGYWLTICIYYSLRVTFLAKKQEIQITVKEKKHGYDTDRYFGTHSRLRTAQLASQ